MATKLTTTGDRQDMGMDPDLKTCQETVGGYIEGMALNPTCGFAYMYCNEDGLMHKLLLNPEASLLAGRPIVGDVVLLTAPEVK
jgi:hypothetical protein